MAVCTTRTLKAIAKRHVWRASRASSSANCVSTPARGERLAHDSARLLSAGAGAGAAAGTGARRSSRSSPGSFSSGASRAVTSARSARFVSGGAR